MEQNEWITRISDLLAPLIECLVCALFALLGYWARRLCTRLSGDSENREKEAVARTAVLATEQICRDLHGKEKLQAALGYMTDLLASRGISVSTEEATLLLESAVAEFNRAFEGTSNTGTAEAA